MVVATKDARRVAPHHGKQAHKITNDPSASTVMKLEDNRRAFGAYLAVSTCPIGTSNRST